MPELPEMEHYQRLLCKQVTQQPITQVLVNRERAINLQVKTFINHVTGKKILDVTRRGKHILFWLDSGVVLLLHLMLGGWMYHAAKDEQPDHTSQIVLSFGETHLHFLGLRLGYLHLLTVKETEERLNDLGPEALDPRLNPPIFHKVLRAKRGVLKSVMVDQKVIAGIGNRYADEIVFDAGIHPLRRIPSLLDREIEQLYQSMQMILEQATLLGGYMEHPFYLGDLDTGGYSTHFRVYNRGDEPCFRCGASIVHDEHGGRKVFYCPNCQA